MQKRAIYNNLGKMKEVSGNDAPKPFQFDRKRSKTLTDNVVIPIIDVNLPNSGDNTNFLMFVRIYGEETGTPNRFAVHTSLVLFAAGNYAGTIGSAISETGDANPTIGARKIVDTWSLTNGIGKTTIELKADYQGGTPNVSFYADFTILDIGEDFDLTWL